MGDSIADAPAISVITCARNSRPDYLQRVMDALARQTLSAKEWEYLLVDNASDVPLAKRFDLGWHPRARAVTENALGLTPARLRGIREASGALLIFVDDDNVLDPDFLEIAQRIAREKPFLGAWSGQCRPDFEAEPPEWTRRYWGMLVIRQIDHEVWSNLARLADTMPCGAGLCVRRDVARAYLQLHEDGSRWFQFDRTGDSLVSGGDNDLAGCACKIGLGVGLSTELKLVHLIPPNRLTLDYLQRLSEGIQFSSTLLDWEWGTPVRKRSMLRRIVDQVRIARAQPPHRQMLRAAFRGRDRALRLLAGRNADAKA